MQVNFIHSMYLFFIYQTSIWKDLLTTYNGNTITYDAIGNPLKYYTGATFTWTQGRQLQEMTLSDGTMLSYQYNENGIRIGKNIDGVETTYFVDASGTVHAMEQENRKLVFFYDSTGRREGFSYYEDDELVGNYYYLYNAQGDVTSILDANFTVVVSYYYDSWGKPTSTTGTLASSLGSLNPFRYRGYIYDEETGFYYLNSRYYDPETGRFINADDATMVALSPKSISDKNLFAYCDNNPVMRVDTSGAVWETVFDVISLGVSVVEVCMNPDDPWAWAGLVGDAIDLIPFVTGVGEITRGVKIARTVVKNMDEATGTLKVLSKGGSKINDLPANVGYNSFKDLKNAIGSAGEGKHWHHIVEQSQIGKSGFSATKIHNTSNIFAIDAATHAKITGYYNTTTFRFTNGLSVRNWLAGQSYEYQYEFGLKILREFGAIQ